MAVPGLAGVGVGVVAEEGVVAVVVVAMVVVKPDLPEALEVVVVASQARASLCHEYHRAHVLQSM